MERCKRCGLCCMIELCVYGRRKHKHKKGHCKFLKVDNNGYTSCQLIIDGTINLSKISFGNGCVFQEEYPSLYNFYSHLYLPLKNDETEVI